jgi:hypothetical protein
MYANIKGNVCLYDTGALVIRLLNRDLLCGFRPRSSLRFSV